MASEFSISIIHWPYVAHFGGMKKDNQICLKNWESRK